MGRNPNESAMFDIFDARKRPIRSVQVPAPRKKRRPTPDLSGSSTFLAVFIASSFSVASSPSSGLTTDRAAESEGSRAPPGMFIVMVQKTRESPVEKAGATHPMRVSWRSSSMWRIEGVSGFPSRVLVHSSNNRGKRLDTGTKAAGVKLCQTLPHDHEDRLEFEPGFLLSSRLFSGKYFIDGLVALPGIEPGFSD